MNLTNLGVGMVPERAIVGLARKRALVVALASMSLVGASPSLIAGATPPNHPEDTQTSVPERVESRPAKDGDQQRRVSSTALTSDPDQALHALDADTAQVSLSFNAAPSTVAILNTEIGEFPTKGPDALVLSTGYASDVAGSSGAASSSIADAPRGVTGNDMTRMTAAVTPPPGARCIAVDAFFLSEEYPDYVGSRFNDVFTVEKNASNLSVVGGLSSISAPNNFATDSKGNILSVNTIYGFTQLEGTSFNGATSRLNIATPIELSPGKNTMDLIFTIQDIGDNVVDSAVVLDNLRFLYNDGCASGAVELKDSDGDGLPDDWEINGINGLDLPAMGADPYRKDLFVQADWMVRPAQAEKNFLGFTFKPGRPEVSFAPTEAAMSKVRKMFADAPTSDPRPDDGIDIKPGIHLHIDAGPHSIMNNAGARWGALAQGRQVDHVDVFESADALPPLSGERKRVFRHALFADTYEGGPTSSGTSQVWGAKASESGGAFSSLGTNFLVTGGSFNERTGFSTDEMAGTFAHELGHTLGLGHGGGDHINGKPNYLSVMNYWFQLGGLYGTNPLNYSAEVLPTLDENDLNENRGVQAGDTGVMFTKHSCPIGAPSSNPFRLVPIMGGAAINWDCKDDATGVGIRSDINRLSVDAGTSYDRLIGYNDWANLKFDASGRIGGQGVSEPPSESTSLEEITEELAIATDSLGTPGSGHASIVGPATLFSSRSGQKLQVDAANLSSEPKTFVVTLHIASSGEKLTQEISLPGLEADGIKQHRLEFDMPSRPQPGIETLTLTINGGQESTTTHQIEYLDPAAVDMEAIREYIQSSPEEVDPIVLNNLKDLLGITNPEHPGPGSGSGSSLPFGSSGN